ncbi:MAG: hypothetical protein LBP93_02025 [Treponema sp.]|jgi:hypothetical protein|nr:hypothetical protein [Treponema sp.]
MLVSTIAKERFEQYLAEKLQNEWDDTVWEFYTWLLDQAKRHKPDYSGYIYPEYHRDEAEAKERGKLGIESIESKPKTQDEGVTSWI